MKSNTRVMIRTGCWAGYEGTVLHERPALSGGDRLVIEVRLTVPVYIAEPDGPKRDVDLELIRHAAYEGDQTRSPVKDVRFLLAYIDRACRDAQ